jgi:5'-deoxynucleotidase
MTYGVIFILIVFCGKMGKCMQNNNFYAMLSRMKYINRWGLMMNTRNENNCEHSLNVAFIAHALGIINNRQFGGNVDAERLAVLGMYHDVTEIITGDMPTPVKYYNPIIRDAYREVEEVAKDQLLCGLPENMRDVYDPLLKEREDEKENWRYVKAADKLSALIKCIEEKRTGNADFIEAEKSTRQAVEALHLPEADYFMEHFLPAYELTLDENAK